MKAYMVLLKITTFLGLVCYSFVALASYELSDREKEYIHHILETKIFNSISKERVRILKTKLNTLLISGNLSDKQKVAVKYIKDISDEVYQSKMTKKRDKENPQLNIQKPLENIQLNIPTLMFHYIENIPESTNDKVRYSLSFSPQKFENLLIFLQKNNIETLTFWDVKDILEGKRYFPQKAIILTFDDGHLSHYTQAFRLLKKYNKKGVFFVVSSKPSSDLNYMNWSQIKEISESKSEIASHTISHPNLTKITNNEQEKEIFTSKNIIEMHTKKPVISFSYPFGAYNKEVIGLVKTKYLFARNTKDGKHFFTNKLYTIPTIDMTPQTSLKKITETYNSFLFNF